MKSLLAGCGNARIRRICPHGSPKWWDELVTLDTDPDCGADVLHNLEDMPYPFEDEEFDEVHAYEVLEHLGTQGDEKFFFDQFNEFWRITKPGGYFCGSVPMWNGVWAWGDPGHKRIIQASQLFYLQESTYDQVGKTMLADYRRLIKGYWTVLQATQDDPKTGESLDSVYFLLQKDES